jgi:hypothetical protein
VVSPLTGNILSNHLPSGRHHYQAKQASTDGFGLEHSRKGNSLKQLFLRSAIHIWPGKTRPTAFPSSHPRLITGKRGVIYNVRAVARRNCCRYRCRSCRRAFAGGGSVGCVMDIAYADVGGVRD